MKITSCDCFEEIGANLIYNKNEDTYNLEIEHMVIFEDGTGCCRKSDNIESIKYCPFCGKKIEVSE